MFTCIYPYYAFETDRLEEGTIFEIPNSCKKALEKNDLCKNYYKTIKTQKPGYFICPYGCTTRTFWFSGKFYAITGIIAFPRFNDPKERALAKKHPEIKTTRKSIDNLLIFYKQIEEIRANEIKSAAKVLPQAFHELRKLNGSILHNSEQEIKKDSSSSSIKTIRSAAELMRNNFDILEALSNIEGIKALPITSSINLFDLCYKAKMIFKNRAEQKGITINLSGERAIIMGSQKSFPIIPAVLIENAIKYGKNDSTIQINISSENDNAMLSVENESDHQMDTERCFEKGARFAPDAAEGGGYGLFLAKEVVLSHHGNISCVFNNESIKICAYFPIVKVIPHSYSTE